MNENTPLEAEAHEPHAQSEASRPPRGGWRTWVLAAGIAVLILAAAFVVSSRNGGDNTGAGPQGNFAPGGGRAFGGGVIGTVASVEGSSFSVQPGQGSSDSEVVRVETTGDTTFARSSQGTASDLESGDNVVVIGERSGDGITAAAITDSGDVVDDGFPRPNGDGRPDGFNPPDDFQPPAGVEPPQGGRFRAGGFTTGTIESINGSQLTVKTSDGNVVAVGIGSDTTISVVERTTVADVHQGDTVRVNGDRNGSTVTASSVQLGDLGFGGRPGFRRGETQSS